MRRKIIITLGVGRYSASIGKKSLATACVTPAGPSRHIDIFRAAQASCIPVKLIKVSKTKHALHLDWKSLAKIKKKKILEKIPGN